MTLRAAQSSSARLLVCLLLVSLACHGALARHPDDKRPSRPVRENRDHPPRGTRDSHRDQSRRESQMSASFTKREEPPKHLKLVQGGVQTSFPYQFVNPMVPPSFAYSPGPQYSNTVHPYTPHLNAPYDAYSAPKAGTSPAPTVVKYEFLPKPASQTAPAPAYSQQSFSQGHSHGHYPQPAPYPHLIPTPAPAMLLVMAPPHPGNPYGALMLIPTQNQGVYPQQPLTLIPVPTAVPSAAGFRGPVAYPTVAHPNLIPVSFKPIHYQRQAYPQFVHAQNFGQNYALKSMSQSAGSQSEETQMSETNPQMDMTNGHSHSQSSTKEQTFGNKVPNFRPISVPS
nr:PREDICTED: extensin-like [Bemisia tabaci]